MIACPNCGAKLLPVEAVRDTVACLNCRETWHTPPLAEPPPFALTAEPAEVEGHQLSLIGPSIDFHE